MEDPKMLAADCIVISCCCQCLILQVLVFILLRLPNKLLKKTKRYVKKLRSRKKGTKIVVVQLRGYDEDSLEHAVQSFRSDVDNLLFDQPVVCSMDELERVLEEFSSNGEFAFGSFWGGEVSSRSFSSVVKEDEIDYGDVQYDLIELFGSVDFH